MNTSFRISTLLLLISCCAALPAADRQLPGRVIHILDGDSLMIDVRGGQYRIELEDIDAPELNQPWGQIVTDRLRRELTGRFVVLHWKKTLADGRVQGRLFLSNRDIGMDLLLDGLAWCTLGDVTEVPDQNRPYRAAEAQARMLRRGLWSDKAPVPPWEWRSGRGGGRTRD